MRRDHLVRAGVAAVLLCALFALCVHLDATRVDGTDLLVTKEALAASPEAYDGERVSVWLDVADVTDDGFSTPPLAGTVPLAVRSGAAVEPGDVVQVVGTVRVDGEGPRLDAERIVVHDGDNQRRMYVVSALGALLASGAFLRRWRVDRRELAFVPREGRDG